MKRVRTISKTTAVLAFITELIKIIVENIEEVTLNLTPVFTLSTMLLAGVVLVFNENKTAEKLGFGILAIVAAQYYGLFLIEYFDKVTGMFMLIVAVLLTISSIVYFVKAMLSYFGYEKSVKA